MFESEKQWIAGRYGSKRGFIRTQWHRLLYFLGRYRKYRQINWYKVDRLVFVCKGNICRSAFAEVVAITRGLNSTSCGVDTVDGAPANERAMEAAMRKGRDLSMHQTRPITSLSIKEGDLFVVMEPWQASYIEEKIGANEKCTLLGLWCSPETPYIHDPYGKIPAHFDYCFDQIEQSISEITREIKAARDH